MKIYTNEKLIRRNSKIAQFTGLAGMAVLVAGMVVLFRFPEQVVIVWATVLGGFVLSQIGIYLTNRYGRRPRPDEALNAALKGLDDNYSIYHYLLPTSHLLLGPAGIWVLIPKFQKGRVVYERGRYRQKGGGFLQGYMRLFGQEGIGRPDLEANAEAQTIDRFLKKQMPDVELPEVKAALLFTNEGALIEEAEVEEAPVPTMPVKKIKELIRKTAKAKPLSFEKVRLIEDALGYNG